MTALAKRDRWDIAALALMLVIALTICLTFRDYGVSWDEGYSHDHGIDFLRWYSSGFHDRTVLRADNQEYIYGAFFNAIAALIAGVLPFGTYESIHLVIALTGLLGIFVTYRIGRLLGGGMAGFISALILTLTPTYYGHAFMNPKDLPFAVLYMIALLCMLREYDNLPRLGARSVIVLGASIGLALGIRVGGVILFVCLAALIFFWHAGRYMKTSLSRAERLRDAGNTIVAFALIISLAWIVMLLWWPYGQVDPIRNPLAVIAKSAHFAEANWTNLYRGVYVPVNKLPWHYLPMLFYVTLPEFYLIGVIAGLVRGVTLLVRRRDGTVETNIHHRVKMAWFVCVVVLPFAAVLLTRPVMYDGTRLFLFCIPPLAVFCGLSLTWLIRRALPPISRTVVVALVTLIAVLTVVDMMRLHPYQYVFFNRTSGGLPAAFNRYETEYWGTSYKEGVEWLAKNYRLDAPPQSIALQNTSNPFLTAYYLDPDEPETRRFYSTWLALNPDVVMSITRWDQHLNYPGRLLHVVRRMDTPLLFVIETRDLQ
jgi:hypothetical protein